MEQKYNTYQTDARLINLDKQHEKLLTDLKRIEDADSNDPKIGEILRQINDNNHQRLAVMKGDHS